ncbi:S8 family serine peptidase [Nodosilinea nodulosa]|uniref:S8 family serine peptidase n=1 Tax=Nodosilinea nodulosa TaxID=416001 RepID=UPI00031F44BB|nr:S8 family serine peptidase [Nodosilinea nodulosa]
MLEPSTLSAGSPQSPLGGSATASVGDDLGGNTLLNLPTPNLSGLADGQQQLPDLALSSPNPFDDQATELITSASVVLAEALAEAANAPAPASMPGSKPDDLLGLGPDQALVATAPLLSTQDSTLSTAQNIGVLVGGRAFGGSVSASDPVDFFTFQLDARSDINLMLSGLSNDADLYLIQDANNNGRVDSGETLAQSTEPGTGVEAITFNNLRAGRYFLAVDQFSGSTNYNLYAAASPDGGVHTQHGNLRANTFELSGTNTYTVISGNGNVDFGCGCGDVLDLSSIYSSSVSSWNPATASGGGVIYDPGNGGRVFDALGLSNGRQILMEGLDGIRFRDGFLNLNSGSLPNDPLFADQWNLHMMGVHQAWRFTQGSSAVLMGIADTGLALSRSGNLHPDLDGERTYGVASNIDDDFVGSTTSHGTAVYGIMAAASNNGVGMSGINWRSDVVDMDVFGTDAYDLDAATAMMTDYAQSTGRRLVVNMSLGAHGPGPGAIPALEQLIAQNQDNALFVIASGNDDDGFTSYPATLSQVYDNVMAVGASWGDRDADGNPTEPGDRISYPDWWGSNYGYGLSLMGPSEVIATAAGQTSGGVGFGYYQNAPDGTPFNGTSAAAPNVSGVASLVWSANPYLSAGQVNSIMQQTAVDLGFPGYDYEYGAGFVNADAAVRRAMALAGTPLRGSSAQTSLALPLVAEDALTLALPVPQGGAASGQPAGDNGFLTAAIAPAPSAAVQADTYSLPWSGWGDRFSDLRANLSQSLPADPAQTSTDLLGESVLPLAEGSFEAALAHLTEPALAVEDRLAPLQVDTPWNLEALTQNLLAA